MEHEPNRQDANALLAKVHANLETFFSTVDDITAQPHHQHINFLHTDSITSGMLSQQHIGKRASDGAAAAGNIGISGGDGVLQPVFEMDAFSAVGSEGDALKPLSAASSSAAALPPQQNSMIIQQQQQKKPSDASLMPTDHGSLLSMVRKKSNESEQQHQLSHLALLRAVEDLRTECSALFPGSAAFTKRGGGRSSGVSGLSRLEVERSSVDGSGQNGGTGRLALDTTEGSGGTCSIPSPPRMTPRDESVSPSPPAIRHAPPHFVRLMQLPSESQQDVQTLLTSPPSLLNPPSPQPPLTDQEEDCSPTQHPSTADVPQFSELLVSVCHPECAASSLVVSFAWDSNGGGVAVGTMLRSGEAGACEGEGQEGGVIAVKSEEEDGTFAPVAHSTSATDPPVMLFEPHPPPPPTHRTTAVVRQAAEGGTQPPQSSSSSSSAPTGAVGPTQHGVPSSRHSFPTIFQSDSVFQLTPIMNNNYVLLGGLGSFQWNTEADGGGSSSTNAPTPTTTATSPSPILATPSSSTVAGCDDSRRLGYGGPITMHEEVLLAYSLKHQHAVVVKVIRPLYLAATAAAAAAVDASTATTATTTATTATASISTRRLRHARRAAMVQELKQLTALRHPNLITLYDVFDEPARDCAYLVYQHCDAGCIRLTVDRNRTSTAHNTVHRCPPEEQKRRDSGHHDEANVHNEDDGRMTNFSPNQVAAYLEGMLSALAYLHANGVAHRNVCVGNLLVDRSGHMFLGGAALPQECSRHCDTRRRCRRSSNSSRGHEAQQGGGDDAMGAIHDEDFIHDVASLGEAFQSLWPSMQQQQDLAVVSINTIDLDPTDDDHRHHGLHHRQQGLWSALGDLVADMAAAVVVGDDRRHDGGKRAPQQLAGTYLKQVQQLLS